MTTDPHPSALLDLRSQRRSKNLPVPRQLATYLYRRASLANTPRDPRPPGGACRTSGIA